MTPLTLSRADLLVLAATAARPRATAADLARLMGMEASTVSRTRRKLERKGTWAPAFALDVSRLNTEPLVAFYLDTNPAASPRQAVEPLRGALADLDISGAFLASDGAALGFATPRGVAKVQALWSRILGLSPPGGSGRLIVRGEHAIFPPGPRTRLRWPDYLTFLRAVLRERLGEEAPLEPEAAEPRPRKPRLLTTTELLVAKELVTHPARALSASTKAVRLPQSTFAHVKMTLIEEGILRETIRVDPTALGYPYLLVTARAHRPHNPHALEADLKHHPCAATAPTALASSDTHGFVLTPVRDSACANEASADFERRSVRFDLVAPTTTKLFAAERSAVSAYSSPADAVGAAFRSWIAP